MGVYEYVDKCGCVGCHARFVADGQRQGGGLGWTGGRQTSLKTSKLKRKLIVDVVAVQNIESEIGLYN